MPAEVRLSHTAAMILQSITTGSIYGFGIMERTGLPSGTVYPALRRLERDALIRSEWEKPAIAERELRPARKYYKVTAAGKSTAQASVKRYPLLEKMTPVDEVRTVEVKLV